jgi:hypothetical protein
MPDLATLIAMFPLIDADVITAVYESTNNHFDETLNQLLEMADPAQKDLINREKIIAVYPPFIKFSTLLIKMSSGNRRPSSY